MNKTKLAVTILSILIILVLLSIGVYFYQQKNQPSNQSTSTTSSSTPSQNLNTYSNSRYGFEIKYPQNFTSQENGIEEWQFPYFEYFNGEKIIAINLPKTSEKTNLVSASISFGASRDNTALNNCLKNQGPAELSKESQETINGILFKRFESVGAGAGNLYRTWSYRATRENICYVVEIIIHSGNIGNYPPDVKEFDSNKTFSDLHSVLQTFTFMPIDQSALQKSGIMGEALIGPNCPVMRIDQPQCADKPYQTTIVIKNESGTKEIARTSTDTNGKFKIDLPPGNYQIGGENIALYPRAGFLKITVTKDQYSSITVYFDTGIR